MKLHMELTKLGVEISLFGRHVGLEMMVNSEIVIICRKSLNLFVFFLGKSVFFKS